MKTPFDFSAVILAGGTGSRLWPLSSAREPKHLQSLFDESLLQQTIRRLLPILPPDRLWIVTRTEQVEAVSRHAALVAPIPSENIVAEPVARNTLPAVLLGVLNVARSDPQAVIGIFPSDHRIMDQDAFRSDLKKASALASHGWLVTFGIKPRTPETGFGYIRAGAPLPEGGLRTEAFLEKPDRATAEHLIARGGHFWNSGIFVFRAAVFLGEVEKFAKEMAVAAREDLMRVYPSLPSLSIDVGIMEKSGKVAVVPASFGWSDLGDWEAVYQILPKDPNGNAVHGGVIAQDNRSSLLWSRQGFLGAVGLENLIVVRSGESVLVCPRDRAQDVKTIAESISQAETSSAITRPWGRYTVLEEGPGYKIKRIVVEAGQKLSLQRHEHRAEHWVVIQGSARVTNGDSVALLNESESTFIPKGQKHRLENAGKAPLVIVEVQTGKYLGEDDIQRFDDIYGRKEV